MRAPFDKSETIPFGSYPEKFGIQGPPKYHRPITSKENTLRYFAHKSPYWIPMLGFAGEVLSFRPRMHPDNIATHMIADGEPPMDYEKLGNPIKGWFDLEWLFVPEVGGATVKPGNPMISDMSEWRSIIKIPDLDEMDWEGSARRNKEFLRTDIVTEVCCLTGLWERLISLMDVSGAAMALIDEDQQEGVHSFFSELCDMYEDMIERYARYFKPDMLLMHDDWGTQRAAFFSLDTCREMLVPYLKRVVDACHKNGMIFELHSCGNNETVVPAMIEAGVDFWCGQPMNNFEMLTERYPDSCLTFGVTIPSPPDGATEDEIATIAQAFVDRYKSKRAVINIVGKTDRRMLMPIYEASRKYYSQFDD